jgi:acetyl esterase/lipase
MARRATRTLTILAALALLVTGCTFFEDDYTPSTLPIPEETDLAYGLLRGCNVSSPATDDKCGGSQELDVYRSEEEGPNPVALWIHGGGFIGGDKGVGVNEYFGELLEAGWDIVAVNYRLATPDGQNQWPTALHDVKSAVRWVKANAEAQDWDPEQVAAIGHSAGGNLAALLATTANEPGLEPNDLPEPLRKVDSSVIAAISLRGVTDIGLYAQSPFGDPVETYLGCTDCPDRMGLASVQPHVDGDSSPVYAEYGADDPIAAPEQGERLRAAFDEAGIGDRFRLVVVDDGPKKFRGHEPDVKRYVGDYLDFLDEAVDRSSV